MGLDSFLSEKDAKATKINISREYRSKLSNPDMDENQFCDMIYSQFEPNGLHVPEGCIVKGEALHKLDMGHLFHDLAPKLNLEKRQPLVCSGHALIVASTFKLDISVLDEAMQ
mgnify:CR=1 FL=1